MESIESFVSKVFINISQQDKHTYYEWSHAKQRTHSAWNESISAFSAGPHVCQAILYYLCKRPTEVVGVLLLWFPPIYRGILHIWALPSALSFGGLSLTGYGNQSVQCDSIQIRMGYGRDSDRRRIQHLRSALQAIRKEGYISGIQPKLFLHGARFFILPELNQCYLSDSINTYGLNFLIDFIFFYRDM